MDTNALAELLYPNITGTIAELEEKYPPRQLPREAKVTRFAPSPTGFVHIGGLFGALTDERLAHQSGGVFMLRIEDTDQKREIEGGVQGIITAFERFGLRFDEGATRDGEIGSYGPYRQRQRAEIYQIVAKQLVREGKAYPCFCSEEDLAAMREAQEKEKANFGYYGKWAVHRDWTYDQIKEAIDEGKPFVLRFRSNGDPSVTKTVHDCIKGDLHFPENDQDMVLLKSDGIPTYHFAHICDDHFMRTTHVVRGEEWLATLPFHIQLFEAVGWEHPQYCHTAQVMKLDGDAKRKLSKRKDPEAAVEYFHVEGFPVPSVLEYLMTLLNSNFEEWRLANPTLPLDDFPFSTERMGTSGSLFDLNKLRDVSKNVVAMLSAEEVYRYLSAWAEEYDPDFYRLLAADPDKATAILQIGRGVPKPRKDIAVWSEMKRYMAFFYDELFVREDAMPERVSPEDRQAILERYPGIYSPEDDGTVWFAKVKELAASLGYAPETKLYKKNPGDYKGHVGDVAGVLRVALTGRTNSPDLCEVCRILGQDKVIERLNGARGL